LIYQAPRRKGKGKKRKGKSQEGSELHNYAVLWGRPEKEIWSKEYTPENVYKRRAHAREKESGGNPYRAGGKKNGIRK